MNVSLTTGGCHLTPSSFLAALSNCIHGNNESLRSNKFLFHCTPFRLKYTFVVVYHHSDRAMSLLGWRNSLLFLDRLLGLLLLIVIEVDLLAEIDVLHFLQSKLEGALAIALNDNERLLFERQ